MTLGLDVSTEAKAWRVLQRVGEKLETPICVLGVDRRSADQHPELYRYSADISLRLTTEDWKSDLLETLQVVDRLGRAWRVVAPDTRDEFNWWGERGIGVTPFDLSFPVPGLVYASFNLSAFYQVSLTTD